MHEHERFKVLQNFIRHLYVERLPLLQVEQSGQGVTLAYVGRVIAPGGGVTRAHHFSVTRGGFKTNLDQQPKRLEVDPGKNMVECIDLNLEVASGRVVLDSVDENG